MWDAHAHFFGFQEAREQSSSPPFCHYLLSFSYFSLEGLGVLRVTGEINASPGLLIHIELKLAKLLIRNSLRTGGDWVPGSLGMGSNPPLH